MRLIINADDFGLSKSITDGIVQGIKAGYITSTTIMVNMKYADYAIKKAIRNKITAIGLHVNLTVGKPLIQNRNLTDKNGIFLYNKEQINNPKLTEIDAYNEIKAQIEKVRELSKGIINIDHLDTHHHLLSNIHIKHAIEKLAVEYNLPVRKDSELSNVKQPDILYHDFTIENVNKETLKNFIANYKDFEGTIELMTHPGFIDDYTKTITSYLGREQELSILEEAYNNGLFKDIKMVSYSDF